MSLEHKGSLEKELIIFDLDGTLAASKSALDSEMAGLIIKLLEGRKVAVISGGKYAQFEKQFLGNLPKDELSAKYFQNLFLLPTSGTRLYSWKMIGEREGERENSGGKKVGAVGVWYEEYSENLSEDDKKTILKTLKEALLEAGIETPEKTYGKIIEDRESQITFSALGQEAPLELKNAWDPNGAKRKVAVDILKERLPNFDVSMGGSTSIDITMKGVNKAYGIHKLEEFLKIPIIKMVFVGDKIFPGGNDYAAKMTGVEIGRAHV